MTPAPRKPPPNSPVTDPPAPTRTRPTGRLLTLAGSSTAAHPARAQARSRPAAGRTTWSRPGRAPAHPSGQRNPATPPHAPQPPSRTRETALTPLPTPRADADSYHVLDDAIA